MAASEPTSLQQQRARCEFLQYGPLEQASVIAPSCPRRIAQMREAPSMQKEDPPPLTVLLFPLSSESDPGAASKVRGCPCLIGS